MDKTYDYSLTASEVDFLVQVLDRAQFSKIQTARIVLALAEKLAAPLGGLVVDPVQESSEEPSKEEKKK